MSAVELAIEKVKSLPEAKAKALLDWLATFDQQHSKAAGTGVASARGFARQFHTRPMTTEQWMKILREGEA